jgi:transglutaminase-like putative cysteine protease
MDSSRKRLVVGVLAVVCALSVAGLVATLKAPAKPPPGPASVSVDLKVVPEVMTADYKAYGSHDQAFATSTITNTGKDPVKNFQISYAIPGYIRAAGQENYPVILPGQTIIDWCFPTFPEKKMRAINSPVTGEVDVTYSYDGSNGPKGSSLNFEFLSHHDWVRTSLPEGEQLDWYDSLENGYMLAAFVTKDDPHVNRVAKHMTGGISTDSDNGAYTAARQIFNELYFRGIDYASEPPSFWKESSQSVQYPLDTLHNTAGNCVDLSVLFASLCEAVAIRTQLFLSSGHCQVGIVLPESGDLCLIEATQVGDPDVSFEAAIRNATAWSDKEKNNGTWYPIDIEAQWAAGTVPSW